MRPFIPGATVNIDVSGSSQSVALAGAKGDTTQVRIHNDGTATVWLEFGVSGVTAATTTGMGIPSGAVEVVTIPNAGGAPYVAAIAAGATGKVYFTTGVGI